MERKRMPRHEKDEWDITSSVGLTALGVACGRAIESKRSDALVTDPYSDALVAAADVEIPTPTRLPHPGYEHDEEFERFWSQIATAMGVRTRFFDDFFADAWRDGVKQAVILASGLDARAWRLDWPRDCTVFEIDQPQVLAFKDEVLAREGAQPRCARRAVAIDLREDWPAALRQAGLDPSQPTAWLAEGLLPYLPDEAEAGLLTAVHELSVPGSRIALENARSVRAIMASDDDWYEQAVGQFGVDLGDLFYDNENRPSPDERLKELGWQATDTPGDELALKYDRTIDAMPARMTQHQSYVVAHLPR
jgi:methyltransferase (TIGR00027 family)